MNTAAAERVTELGVNGEERETIRYGVRNVQGETSGEIGTQNNYGGRSLRYCAPEHLTRWHVNAEHERNRTRVH